MKIGLRTIKTAVSATLAMVVAGSLGLLYPASAGIISVLSVTNTKKTSILTGLYRLLSLALATGIAYICFTLFGFNPVAFGIFLLLFIPSAVYFKLSDGIVVSSVLVTQYLVEKNLSWAFIGNEFLLMTIGVGFALLMNAYMPDAEKRLKEDQEVIEVMFRKILNNMAAYLNQHGKERNLFEKCDDLKAFIRTGETWAKTHAENHLLSSDDYYLNYFTMRRMQSNSLKDMLRILEKITVEPEQVESIQQLLEYTAETFAETNDGQAILDRITQVYDVYRKKELPKTREEFENRAQIFQLLQVFHSFIQIKAEFSRHQNEKAL
ncbi:aromatic acid exporter family protein [Enterococcus wangshanyuanii]|uniref:Membrane protein n=1 Tax=Enterococcus wangshanyuanii TaxID=2005703 RepID=A0ABQ1NSB6_9ENTE|nr:aromatic acid exporter family protein [Enterococcus wangshanyuanii]GGC84086.1 membrane protein [Enterococcus wangshanyuanii]